ncbi:hypothetical protein ACFU8W_20500 [Streptomyces sp. NPDC057565]|uniref:hypothetical protein n=1 Tax=Streptomyces sp. NPDC057565 TaxID=3346169 RepID=UPI00368BE157
MGIVLVGAPVELGLAVLISLLTVAWAVLACSWRYFEEPHRRHAGSFPASGAGGAAGRRARRPGRSASRGMVGRPVG